jgi:hypothetical protein
MSLTVAVGMPPTKLLDNRSGQPSPALSGSLPGNHGERHSVEVFRSSRMDGFSMNIAFFKLLVAGLGLGQIAQDAIVGPSTSAIGPLVGVGVAFGLAATVFYCAFGNNMTSSDSPERIKAPDLSPRHGAGDSRFH